MMLLIILVALLSFIDGGLIVRLKEAQLVDESKQKSIELLQLQKREQEAIVANLNDKLMEKDQFIERSVKSQV